MYSNLSLRFFSTYVSVVACPSYNCLWNHLVTDGQLIQASTGKFRILRDSSPKDGKAKYTIIGTICMVIHHDE